MRHEALPESVTYDLVVIGGGVNGCGIARDATGRGLSVLLVEKDDLASATSSASTKLFHGGLRYLEYFEFRLVREALVERETLLAAMPHISWPMRFVLPINPQLRYENDTSRLGTLLRTIAPFLKGRRPALLTRLGLVVYDHLGGRKILPGTKTLDLTSHPTGAPLKRQFQKAFEYSDCWVEDSRLVVLNAKDAVRRGARVMTRTSVKEGTRRDGHWSVMLEDMVNGGLLEVRSRGVVNAAGPWVNDVLNQTLRQNSEARIRLVRGSHIVTRKLFDHDQPYIFQLMDGRIIFAIPYETDFTLIGTTDADHDDADAPPECTPAERAYLLAAASEFFERPLVDGDIVWAYSGVRPLYDDDAKSATAATRDYVLSTSDQDAMAPLLSVFGGKITTYRRLAQDAVDKLARYYPEAGPAWTAGVPLPGGDFPIGGSDDLRRRLQEQYPFLDDRWAHRLIRAYGTEAGDVLGPAMSANDLGERFTADLTAREVDWLKREECARTADDVLWRRSKLGLRADDKGRQRLHAYLTEEQPVGVP